MYIIVDLADNAMKECKTIKEVNAWLKDAFEEEPSESMAMTIRDGDIKIYKVEKELTPIVLAIVEEG